MIHRVYSKKKGEARILDHMSILPDFEIYQDCFVILLVAHAIYGKDTLLGIHFLTQKISYTCNKDITITLFQKHVEDEQVKNFTFQTSYCTNLFVYRMNK